jgi:hypothetical protein
MSDLSGEVEAFFGEEIYRHSVGVRGGDCHPHTGEYTIPGIDAAI